MEGEPGHRFAGQRGRVAKYGKALEVAATTTGYEYIQMAIDGSLLMISLHVIRGTKGYIGIQTFLDPKVELMYCDWG